MRPAVDDKTRVGTPVIPAAPSATAKTTAVPPVGDKTRPVRLTEKTGVVPNLGSKRSFFGTTGSERVYSKEPPEIIEKPATIKSRSKFDKTSDLQEIPHHFGGGGTGAHPYFGPKSAYAPARGAGDGSGGGERPNSLGRL